ncbi:hypothetical protein Q3H58_002541 [Pseudomonas psychrotolerans]|nr:hypothetical protein [Pseudomonas psychrotolerans]
MSVVFVAASQLPTPFGLFTMHGFLDETDGKEHVALTFGDVADGEPVLGRLHSECLTGERPVQPEMRLRFPAGSRATRHRRSRAWRVAVPASGRARHRPAQQDPRL